MHPGPSRRSIGTTRVFIFSRRPFRKGPRRLGCFNNRSNFSTTRERAFAIEVITRRDIPKGGNFPHRHRLASVEARRALRYYVCSRKEDDHAGQNPEACSYLYSPVGGASPGAP